MKDFAAIVLGAGASTRMGQQDKLLALLHGQPVITHVLTTLAQLGLSQVIVVGGDNHEALDPPVSRVSFDMVVNPDPGAGLGTSLAFGAQSLSEAASGAFICLGDMPLVTALTYRVLAEKFRNSDRDDLCAVVPMFQERQGHPVLFSRSHFGDLQACSGDHGARHVLEAHLDHIERCPVVDPGCVLDVDNQEDLSAAARVQDAATSGHEILRARKKRL